jgi:hypothetical protein
MTRPSGHFSTPCDKEWVTERLSRARNAPLVLDLRVTSKDTFSLFLPHISHVRELYLHSLSFVCSDIFQEINIHKALALERLELNEETPSPLAIQRLVGDSFSKGLLPNLRILCLSQILFPWTLIPRGRLTQLKVTLAKEVPTLASKDSQHGDLKQLISLLIDCPSLEVLTLENCLPAEVSGFSGRQTIHLLQLSRLSLGGSSSRVTNLLKMLKLSPSTALYLNCTSENTATQNDYHILPLISTHFNDPIPVKFRGFTIELDEKGHVILVAPPSLPISPIPYTDVIRPDSDAELLLSLDRVVELNNRMDFLGRACDMLPLSNLEFLSIYLPSPNQLNWGEIFQHCTEVTMVEVSQRGTIGLLDALTPPELASTEAQGKGKRGGNDKGAQAQAPDDDDGLAPVHVPIFPKLTSLSLEWLDFTDEVPGSGVLYDLVMNAVQRRKANKTPLTTLCIEHCVIMEKQAKALEKVVSDFRWDHDEGYDDDEEGDREDYQEYYGDELLAASPITL